MKKKKVLIVEDDLSLCSLLENILKPTYDIAAMHNSVEAWQWLSQGNYPELIVTDFKMPLIDGLEFVENIKTSGLFRKIPIFIISGNKEPHLKERFETLGIKSYFTKPFSPEILITAIDKVLKRKLMSNVQQD